MLMMAIILNPFAEPVFRGILNSGLSDFAVFIEHLYRKRQVIPQPRPDLPPNWGTEIWNDPEP